MNSSESNQVPADEHEHATGHSVKNETVERPDGEGTMTKYECTEPECGFWDNILN